MKNRLLYGGLVVVLGLNLFFGARIYLSSATASEKDDTYPNLALFARVLEMVRKDYVDGEKLTYHDLIHGALDHIVPNAIHSAAFAPLLPNATLTVIPDAGHTPHHSHTALFLDAIHRAGLR